MMNEAAKTDSDSLMALQALLKFRSDSFAESGEALPAGKSLATTTTVGAVTKYAAPSIENNRKRPAPPTAQQQQHRPTASKVSHVTPPFGAVSPGSAFSPTFTLNLGMQQNDTHLAGASAPFSPQVDPIAVPSAPYASLQVLAPNSAAACPVKSGTEAAAVKAAVRTTEIEAALRSKPQRGKKRDNLSDLERLELTRTRNREHAKSTRIRKKARHQELLDNEEKYHELKTLEDLRKGRSECVSCFLSTRQSILRSSLDEPNASSPEEENQSPLQGSNQAVSSNEQNQGQVTPQRVVKFLLSNESFLASTTSSSVVDTDAAIKLGGVVDSDFEFTIAGSTLDSFSSDAPETAMAAMARFEKSLATRVQEKLGHSFVHKLCYNVASNEGIAVNDYGTGFAEVVVSTRRGHFDIKLMTCLLQLSFVPDSYKLKAVVWNITEDLFHHLPDDIDSDCPSCSSESLCCQTSFPSVVSLDAGEQKPPALEDGPGMDI